MIPRQELAPKLQKRPECFGPTIPQYVEGNAKLNGRVAVRKSNHATNTGDLSDCEPVRAFPKSVIDIGNSIDSINLQNENSPHKVEQLTFIIRYVEKYTD